MTVAERLEIEGANGAHLAARIDRPVGQVRGVALFAHCFTCSKDTPAARRIASELARLGIAVVRFDFTGLGGSGGDFASTDFSANVADVVAVVKHVRATFGSLDLLIGHSLGGAAVLAAAPDLPDLKGVVTIGAPADPAHVLENFSASIEAIERDGVAEVSLAGRPFTIRRAFLDDVRAAGLEEHLARLRAPLLVMHSPLDDTVAIDNATRIFTAAKHPKSFVSLDRADHLLTRERDARHVASVVAGWFASRLPSEPRGEVDHESVVVAETGGGKFQNAVRAGRHRLFADEPQAVGGLDSGPSPYDYLAASLGACTSMTLRMYADRKGVDPGRIEVRVDHERVHARDCEDCTDEVREGGGSLDRFTRTIVIHPPAGAEPLDEAFRERLLAIADKCPVHRTLEGVARIETALASD